MAADPEPIFVRLDALSRLRGLAKCLEETACEQRGEPLSLAAGLAALSDLWYGLRASGGRVFWIGNGGSAAVASHLSQDLLNKGGVSSMTLNDPALITCMANDYGYRAVFARPLSTLAQQGDVLVALSSSGMSDNIVDAAVAALERGLQVVALSAFSADNRLRKLNATLSFHVPTSNFGHAELGHAALLHTALDCLQDLVEGSLEAAAS